MGITIELYALKSLFWNKEAKMIIVLDKPPQRLLLSLNIET